MTHDLPLIAFSALAGYSARGLVDYVRTRHNDRRTS